MYPLKNQRKYSKIKSTWLNTSKGSRPSIKLKFARIGSWQETAFLGIVALSLTAKTSWTTDSTFPRIIKLDHARDSMRSCIALMEPGVSSNTWRILKPKQLLLRRNKLPLLQLNKTPSSSTRPWFNQNLMLTVRGKDFLSLKRLLWLRLTRRRWRREASKWLFEDLNTLLLS